MSIKFQIRVMLIIGILSMIFINHAYAYDFEKDGLCYNILSEEDRTVEVTHLVGPGYYDEYRGNYDGLKDVNIPDKLVRWGKTYYVIAIGEDAFRNCKSLTSVTISNSIPKIADYAFYCCKALKSVRIGNSVTTIGEQAFAGCNDLSSLTIGNSVTTIGEYAFDYCVALKSVTIPDSVTTIGDHAFNACKTLSSLTIGNSVATIGEYAFENCVALTSVTIPDSVTTIGEYAFDYCVALKSVTIGNSVTTIGDHAFNACKTLSSLTIGNSVATIGEYAFKNCVALTSVTIPDSVTTIGSSAFYECKTLSSVTIGNSVTTIGEQAFSGCSNLESIYVDSGNVNYSSYGGILYSKDKSTLICCPGIKTNVNILNSVTTIKDYAFDSCDALMSVTIPNSVTKIGDGVFTGCVALSSLYNMSKLPVECEPTFPNNVIMNATLYVPTGTLAAYQKVDPWRNFWNIQEMDYSGVVSSIVLNESEMILNEGQSATLIATITPDTANNKTLSWTSSNEAVATVTQDGKVTAISKGMAVITAKSTDGSNISASCTVNVVKLVSSIHIDPTTVTLKVGEQATINAYALPADATNPTLKWYSDDSTVASVEDGVVTAIKEGSTIIFVETTDGSNISERCRVKVEKRSAIDSVSTDEIKVSVSNGTITILNVPVNQMAQILQTNGTTVKKQISTGEVISYRPANKGVYIIVVGNETFKVVI